MRKIIISLLASLALSIAIPAASQAATKTSKRATSDEQQVLVLLNQIRQQHNLTPFTALPQLRNAARFHSTDMISQNYFEHNSPNESWDARISRYLKSPLIGEDIAWGQGTYGTPDGIVNQWMHSPIHRAIILTAGLHHIGLGLALGTYDGTPNAVMATADFAA
jgi:uncharacterized protein YkwD